MLPLPRRIEALVCCSYLLYFHIFFILTFTPLILLAFIAHRICEVCAIKVSWGSVRETQNVRIWNTRCCSVNQNSLNWMDGWCGYDSLPWLFDKIKQGSRVCSLGTSDQIYWKLPNKIETISGWRTTSTHQYGLHSQGELFLFPNTGH